MRAHFQVGVGFAYRGVMLLSYSRRLATLLMVIGMLSLARSTVATPTDDLRRAVTMGTSVSVANAEPETFMRAFVAVVARVHARDVAAYTGAAVKLRPDLADRTVVASLTAARLKNTGRSQTLSCQQISRIISAAVAAAPEKAAAIVAAAVRSIPSARQCIVAAAIAVAPGQAVAIREAAEQSTTLAVINPIGAGNINPVDIGPENVVTSPEQPPAGP